MSSSQDTTNSVEKKLKMNLRKAKTSIPINPKILHLPCEWEECQFITEDMEDFIKHISEHLSSLISNVTPPEQVLGCFNCKWQNCDVAVIGHISDFTRHVYFHTFHTKIKCIGNILIRTLGLHACTLDGQSCNLIPDLPERLQCGWFQCGAIYDNPEFFYRHVSFHADTFQNGNNLKGGCDCLWEGCDVNVKSKHKLREHLRSHTQQKLVACPNCGGLFANRTKFFDHLERQTDTQWFQCSHCNKKFQTERLLRDHIRIHVNSYKCPLCEMTCPNPHGLRNHLLYKHTTERHFACPECEYRTKTQATLQRHMETHSENVFMCHEKGCGFVSRLYQCLAAHYQKIHQGIDTRRYACHVCNQRFIRGNFLTKHLQTSHNYKWPSGYSRFRYIMHSDGFLRLQTVRYESVNLIEQVIDTNAMSATNSRSPETSGNAEQAPDNVGASENAATAAATNSGGGGGEEEVSITYNLEMLGDVALLNPNKLGVAENTEQVGAASAEEADQGDECLEEEENPHSLDTMDPSTSAATEISDPHSMDVEITAEKNSFVSDNEEDQEASSDDNNSNLFGIYSEISSDCLNSV